MYLHLRSAIYEASDDAVIDKMFEMAKVTKDDIVFDLGCGDGRILVAAAKKFGCKGVGVEFKQERVEAAHDLLQKSGVSKNQVEIRFGDAFKVPDLERATVVTLYVLPWFLADLEPQIKTRLKPGTRVVSHRYAFPNLEPDAVAEVNIGGGETRRVYLWIIRAPSKQ